MRTFQQLHPVVNLIFFLLVLTLTMLQLHPVFLAISGLCAVATLVTLSGKRSVSGGALMGLMLLIAVGNALLNPAGDTILFTWWNGRAFTLEALAWGGSAALLFGSVTLWFACFHRVMTGEKLMYLFGRLTPTLALLFCMVLRFVPTFFRQLKTLSQTRSSLGLGIEQCSTAPQKVHCASAQLAAFLSLALEQAAVTANSMRGRGYGLPGRTSYARFRMDAGNGFLLVLVLALGGIVLFSLFLGAGSADYFPGIALASGRPLWLGAGAAGLLMGMPVWLAIGAPNKT